MPELFKGVPDSYRESNPVRSPEISGRFIEQLFTSPDFEATFKKTFDLVGKHGGEYGFSILNEFGSDSAIVTRSIGGGAEGETELGIGQEKVEHSKRFKNKKLFILSTLHFHNISPIQDEVLNPSLADLSRGGAERECNLQRTGFDIPPIQILALRTSNKNTRLLIFRETLVRLLTQEVLEDLDTSLEEAMANGDNQREIMRLLQNYGYQVIFIPNFSGKFSKQDLDILQRFAFIPKRKKED